MTPDLQTIATATTTRIVGLSRFDQIRPSILAALTEVEKPRREQIERLENELTLLGSACDKIRVNLAEEINSATRSTNEWIEKYFALQREVAELREAVEKCAAPVLDHRGSLHNGESKTCEVCLNITAAKAALNHPSPITTIVAEPKKGGDEPIPPEPPVAPDAGTPTPETDVKLLTVAQRTTSSYLQQMVYADVARKLERERDDYKMRMSGARDERNRMERERDEAIEDVNRATAGHNAALAQLEAVTKERDKMKVAVESTGRHHNLILTERDSLASRLETAESRCAIMRQAVEEKIDGGDVMSYIWMRLGTQKIPGLLDYMRGLAEASQPDAGTAMLAELKAAREDVARLDWIDGDKHLTSIMATGGGWRFRSALTGDTYANIGNGGIRAAIDDAAKQCAARASTAAANTEGGK